MKTITEDLILTAKYLTKNYTMAEIAGILEVRAEELRAAISQYEAGEWKDPIPETAKEEPKKRGKKK
jgi:hypothetical protein